MISKSRICPLSILIVSNNCIITSPKSWFCVKFIYFIFWLRINCNTCSDSINRLSIFILNSTNRNIKIILSSSVGSNSPIAPQYIPRGELSNCLIYFIVFSFGAPVIEPQGNNDVKI